MLLLAFVCFCFCSAQDSSNMLVSIPTDLFDKVARAQNNMAAKVQKENEKLLHALHSKEEKIYRKLYSLDSGKAKQLYGNALSEYASLEKRITNSAALPEGDKLTQYVPRMDSLQTMLKFLSPLAKNKQQVDKALASVEGVNNKLGETEDIESFIKTREAVCTGIRCSFQCRNWL